MYYFLAICAALVAAAFYVGLRLWKARGLAKGLRRVVAVVVWSGFPLLFGAAMWNFSRQEIQIGRMLTASGFVAFFITVAVLVVLYGVEDIVFGLRRLYQACLLRRGPKDGLEAKTALPPLTRSSFLMQASLAVGALPVFSVGNAVFKGAYDYFLRSCQLYIDNLPRAFDGLRIVQISDIHVGSFWTAAPLQAGIDLALQQKPDLIVFTGDVVNQRSSEMKAAYAKLFSQLKAPMGVYSILGNHDYGDYASWPNEEAKEQNFKDMLALHRALGWRLLRNESVLLQHEGAQLPLVGVENWGKGRFAKYGDLAEANNGLEEHNCRLLLSHDPSHWDLQVRKKYPEIKLTLSGHTHGFQMGVETPDYRWSPSKYFYKQWDGHYESQGQHLYVNRGFGFIGFPGRMGMPPEITFLELRRSFLKG